MASNPDFQIPIFPGDERFLEASRHELPESVYGEAIPEEVEEQYTDSYGEKDKGWRVVKVKLAGAALVLIVSVAGAEYFRRHHGEDE